MVLTVALLAVFSVLTGQASAESHKVTFTNNCGKGTPKLVQNGQVLSTGDAYTSNGVFESVRAFLDNGNCKLNGDGCSVVELTLKNGANGAASSVDISLIPPLAFSDPIGFQYTGGCSEGAFCSEATCNTAFFKPDDNCVQVACQVDDGGANIIFCGGSTHFTDPSQTGVPCGSSNSTSAGGSSSSAGASSGNSTAAGNTGTSTPGTSSTSTAV